MPTIRDEAIALQDSLVNHRRALHRIPELQNETFKTMDYVADALGRLGCEDIHTGVAGSGVTALIRGSLPGDCLGIRADMDGLPVGEDTGLPFASAHPGKMHACGHDAHTAMLLGAAELLTGRREALRGSVKLIFQPYEEGAGGSRPMIEEGVLENPDVKAMAALHTGCLFEGFKSGEIGWGSDSMSYNITAFRARFVGSGGHTSSPHLARHPVTMACHAALALQNIHAEEKNPDDPLILLVNNFHGGTSHLVIPSECVIEGTIRSRFAQTHSAYVDRVRELCEETAKMYRGSCAFEIILSNASIEVDSDILARFLRSAPKVVPAEQIREIKQFPAIGEDFSFFSRAVPSVYFFHCAAPEQSYPHHHPKFDIDEDQLWSGAALLAQFALDWQT